MAISAQELADLMPDTSQLESNEPEMESSLHYAQLALLVACLEWLWRDKDDFFVGANLTIYFSREQLKNRDFRGPDFFLFNKVEKKPRKSWVVWEEGGRYPDLIIELLSDSTARTDRNLKKALYQDRFRTPEYFWFSPETLEFEGYRLMNGIYEAIAPAENGYFCSQSQSLYLGVHQGQLRYFQPNGDLVLTPGEYGVQSALQAESERQKAESERQKAASERQRAETLAAQLRKLGIEPEA
ncbi:MAG: Uma2 family endonuclease [Phormidesmis sp.]